MNLNRTIQLIVTFLVLKIHLWGQESSTDFNFVNIKGGISKTAVSTIIQDHYGFVWIGTNGAGIHRYDGIEYISYPNTSKDALSINSRMIFCTYLDKNNRLWVGTESGLSLYDREQDQFKSVRLRPDTSSFDTHMAVSSITEDKEGNLFVGVFEKGLFKLNVEERVAHHIPNIGFSTRLKSGILNINDLKTDSNGKIYVGTNVGLKEYDPVTQTLRPSIFLSQNGSQTIQEPIQSLLITKNNDIWIGTLSSGLYKVNRTEEESTQIIHVPLTTKRILSLITVPDETILCGTENDGLFHVSNEGIVLKNYLFDKKDKNSIRSNSIWSLFLDQNERIWMGYYNSGTGVYDKLYDKFNHIESLPSKSNSLETSSVTGIVQDQSNKLWISMDGGGIDIYDPKTLEFKHINTKSTDISGLTSNDIQTIFVDSKENIWVGSWNSGIFLLKKGTQRFINFNTSNTSGELSSNSVLSFAEDASGKIWIGTFYGGLLSYDYENNQILHHDTKEFVQQNIHKSSIRKVLVDHNNNVWVGSTTGLFKVNIHDQNKYTIVSMRQKMSSRYQNSLNANHILSIYESSNNTLWIGTRGAGLCRYDQSKNKFTWYNEQYGINEENVSSIIESSDGNIWISGNEGIHKIDLSENNSVHYSINDGLLSNDFNFNAVYKDEEGNLYFGSYKGIDYFDPKNIKINSSKPHLYLTGFKLFNKKVSTDDKNSPLQKVISETDSISLTHKQSVFTIEYTGINYTRPEKNQYAYYLEGLEKSWNYVGNTRSATYTNLDYGNYTFRVKAANNDGVWSDESLNLKITILPPWWKTNWAMFSYILLFFLGIYLLNKVTKERIKEKQLIKYEREQRLKEEELHKKKLQFFTNISHEFRTPLTLIINPLIDIIKSKTYNLPEEVKEKHFIIYKNTNRLSRLINELMDFRKLEINKLKVKAQEINIVDFVKEIVSYFSEEALNKKINLKVECDTENLIAWVDKSMIEKIIFNLLSNAFKVTPEKGEIEVRISTNAFVEVYNETIQNSFEIQVRDTGPGLEKEQLSKIFERFYQVNNLNKWYYGGTGIGLEVVRSFVELHKGSVEVDSEINKGTVFKIVLPLGKSHFGTDEIFTDSENRDTVIKEKLVLPSNTRKKIVDEDSKKHRLLIVEDNTELRNYLEHELRDNYKIFTATNGNEGLKQAKKEMPDIIITDVIMPEMNGFDFCSKIKTDIQTSHIPLLMLTAKTMHEDRLIGIESGADAYMSKPFDLRVLKSRLAQLLSSRQVLFNKYFSAISDTEINENTTSLDKEFIEKVLKYINESLSDPDLSVEILASQLHLSRSQFYRKIKTLTGQTANQFLRNIRLQRAKQILEKGYDNISDVCYQVGFSSPSYFTKCFKNHFGVLPTEIESEKQ
ncbi:two-component regulator propeller domain-containing protein [Aquimarina gracilis]|uniref:histidine kinase n=1 Tax=Aquimarina gracilis TaxID=874422 RepID=A0ABU5ZRT4_9FLAO|nr:two-component regulator propeller domain-containing protein [Aquimarina gracilis]MEB3344774.1 two-component regulator propeller domain-containing protein [Aquimarina gracilis]